MNLGQAVNALSHICNQVCDDAKKEIGTLISRVGLRPFSLCTRHVVGVQICVESGREFEVFWLVRFTQISGAPYVTFNAN